MTIYILVHEKIVITGETDKRKRNRRSFSTCSLIKIYNIYNKTIYKNLQHILLVPILYGCQRPQQPILFCQQCLKIGLISSYPFPFQVLKQHIRGCPCPLLLSIFPFMSILDLSLFLITSPKYAHFLFLVIFIIPGSSCIRFILIYLQYSQHTRKVSYSESLQSLAGGIPLPRTKNGKHEEFKVKLHITFFRW